jgi:hypothetical protein
MSPVMIKGMSIVLFITIAGFMKELFAINKLDKIWTRPIGMKYRIDTFFIFMKVSTGRL